MENDTLTFTEDNAPNDIEETQREVEIPSEESASEFSPPEEGASEEFPPLDYEKMAEEDLKTLKAKFPPCRQMTHIGELQNPLRYAALRDLGLSPEEAYLATNYPRLAAFTKDNRGHLSSAVPKGAAGDGMSAADLSMARDLFGDLSDSELVSLYRRATGRGR